MKLAKSPRFSLTSVLHFKRVAARAMRQLLIEAARRRSAEKRGPDAILVTLDDAAHGVASVDSETDLVKLDAALEELAQLNPRQALMVEARFFGGLDLDEAAELLNVSKTTIVRDWRATKAWLAHRLRNMP